jgi:DNA polymerase V
MTRNKVFFYAPENNTKPLYLNLLSSSVSAGFPSPAEDYVEQKLDLNVHLITNPPATFFVKAVGDSMEKIGIFSGDMLVVDRSKNANNGSIIIAVLDGELLVKRYGLSSNNIHTLIAENDEYETIEIKRGQDFEIWGVVTSVIHKFN